MNFSILVNERAMAQVKLNQGRNLSRNELVVEALGHLIEEVIEARQCVPRRFWKTEKFDREEFIIELADIVIWLANTAGLAGIGGEEMEQAIEAKLKYNSTRADHIVLTN